MSVVIPASIYRNKQKALSRYKSKEKERLGLRVEKRDLIVGLMGLILGQAVLLEGVAPFGVAFLTVFANTSPQSLMMIGLGVGIGSVLARGWLGLGVVVAAFLGIYIIRLWKEKELNDVYKGLIVSGMVLGFHLLRYFLHLGDFYHLLMGTLEPMLILCLSWLFAEGLTQIFSGEAIRLARINVLAILFITAGVIIGFPPIELMGVQITGVAIQTILLVVALAGGMTHATVMGMFLGVALTLTGYYDPVVIGLYGFIGLTAGFFREYGRITVVLGMFLATLLFAGLEMMQIEMSVLMACLVASGIFFVVPGSFITNLRRYLPGTGELLIQEANYQKELEQRFTERLGEFSKLFSELATTFNEVSAAEEVEEDDLGHFLYIFSNRVCKGCDFENYCWDKQFYQTYTQMLKLLSVLENRGQATSEDFIRLLKGHCRNLGRLKDSVDGSLEIYEVHRHWEKKLRNQQRIVGEQLAEVSRIIDGFSRELDLSSTKKEDLERVLKIRLEEAGLKIVQCWLSGEAGDGQLNVSLTKERCLGEGECRRVFKVINQMVQQPMSNYERSCGLETGQGLCHLKFCPAQRFKIDVGFINQPQQSETVSGDTLAYQHLKSGKFMTILSDGMGTGEDAARESRTASRLVQKIIRAGFDHDLAARTVNTALLSRSTDECFATVDLSFVDLFNGEIEFIKIGAAASFIKRGSEVNLVRGSSLPVGIMDTVEPMSFKRRLESGDFVIMLSDGILDAIHTTNQEDWMARLLRKCSFQTADDLAKYIYDQVIAYGIPEDDMTVVVLKLEEERLH